MIFISFAKLLRKKGNLYFKLLQPLITLKPFTFKIVDIVLPETFSRIITYPKVKLH